MAVLMIGPKQWLENEQIYQNVENLRNRLQAHNISLDKAMKPKKIYMANCRFNENVQGEITKALDSVVRDKANALLVVLPFEMKLLYDYVKRQCDIKSGIRSLCVTSPRFVCNHDRFFLHLALKLNLKTGGTNQVLKSVRRKTLSMEKTMVVGVQIMLPPKQAASSAKGFIATVASSGGALSHWPAHVQVLDNEPLNEVFLAMLENRTKVWNTSQYGTQNGAKQQELRDILIYQDHSDRGRPRSPGGRATSIEPSRCHERKTHPEIHRHRSHDGRRQNLGVHAARPHHWHRGPQAIQITVIQIIAH